MQSLCLVQTSEGPQVRTDAPPATRLLASPQSTSVVDKIQRGAEEPPSQSDLGKEVIKEGSKGGKIIIVEIGNKL